jgi:WD40 repeat protein
MRILPDLGAAPLCLACSPDSRFLYVGCQDGAIHAWDRLTDQRYHIFQNPVGDPVLTLACSGDGSRLAVSCSRWVLLQTPTTGDVLRIDCLGLGTALVAFASEDRLVYTAHGAGMLRYHRAEPRDKVKHRYLAGPGGLPVLCAQDTLALAARPETPWVVLGHGRASHGGVMWWRFDSGGLIQVGSWQVNSPVCAVAIAPSGDRLAVGTRAGLVTLIEPASSTEVNRYAAARTRILASFQVTRPRPQESRDKGVFGLAFTQDGRELLTVSSDGDCGRWDIASQRLLHSLDWHLGCLRGLAFAPDGQTAAAITEGRTVVVWDVD